MTFFFNFAIVICKLILHQIIKTNIFSKKALIIFETENINYLILYCYFNKLETYKYINIPANLCYKPSTLCLVLQVNQKLCTA